MIFIKFFAWSVFTRIPVWAVCKLNNCDDIVRVEIVLAAGVFRGGSIPLFLLSWLLPLHCFQCLYCHFFIITFRQPFFMFLSWKRLNLTTWFIFCIDSSKILFQLPRLSVHGALAVICKWVLLPAPQKAPNSAVEWQKVGSPSRYVRQ